VTIYGIYEIDIEKCFDGIFLVFIKKAAF